MVFDALQIVVVLFAAILATQGFSIQRQFCTEKRLTRLETLYKKDK